MTRRTYLALAVVGVLVTAVAVAAPRPRWQDKFGPTRLQWLEMTLNARDRHDCDTRGRAYCVGFEYQAQDPDALQIVMFTHGEVPEYVYESAVSQAKSNVEVRAKLMGQPVGVSVRRLEAPVATP